MTATAKAMPSTITVHVPLKFTIRGGRKTIIGQMPQPATHTRFDNSIAKALARAHRWRSKDRGRHLRFDRGTREGRKDQQVLRLPHPAADAARTGHRGKNFLDRRTGSFTVEELAKPISTNWMVQRSALQRN